jgi:hypothetical protein
MEMQKTNPSEPAENVLRILIAPQDAHGGGGGLLEKLYEKVEARHAEELALAKAEAEAEQAKLRAANASLEQAAAKEEALEAQLRQTREMLALREGELETARAECRDANEQLNQFDWLKEEYRSAANLAGQLNECVKGGSDGSAWYTGEFQEALVFALMTVHCQLTVESPFIPPASIMQNIDETFYRQLGVKEPEKLERLRQRYMGWFNELAGGRYEIRWPAPGGDLDGSYAVDIDNTGLQRVRVAQTCAVLENGQVTSKARVEMAR